MTEPIDRAAVTRMGLGVAKDALEWCAAQQRDKEDEATLFSALVNSSKVAMIRANCTDLDALTLWYNHLTDNVGVFHRQRTPYLGRRGQLGWEMMYGATGFIVLREPTPGFVAEEDGGAQPEELEEDEPADNSWPPAIAEVAGKGRLRRIDDDAGPAVGRLLTSSFDLHDPLVPIFIQRAMARFPGMPFLLESIPDGYHRLHYRPEYHSMLFPMTDRPSAGIYVSITNPREGWSKGAALVIRDMREILPEEDRFILSQERNAGKSIGSYTQLDFEWIR